AQAIQRALEAARAQPLPPHVTFQEATREIPDEWTRSVLDRAIAHYEARRFGSVPYDVNAELEWARTLEQLQKHAPARAA
ncbi:MAG: hypothetical protein AAFQ82_07105, partial [Myxococcota bacterium]